MYYPHQKKINNKTLPHFNVNIVCWYIFIYVSTLYLNEKKTTQLNTLYKSSERLIKLRL